MTGRCTFGHEQRRDRKATIVLDDWINIFPLFLLPLSNLISVQNVLLLSFISAYFRLSNKFFWMIPSVLTEVTGCKFWMADNCDMRTAFGATNLNVVKDNHLGKQVSFQQLCPWISCSAFCVLSLSLWDLQKEATHWGTMCQMGGLRQGTPRNHQVWWFWARAGRASLVWFTLKLRQRNEKLLFTFDCSLCFYPHPGRRKVTELGET